uniref:Uncharacterized protein n=2 Tax=Vannella robusta TaxID=1487602 RepID=A0A7S4MP11_9EUKA|mmetsp:Transcript_5095/g.6208  ORF Transcript_5095/g.6208 Transcript_5095/m.6208 type:complete len:170 (+) Transcript_5095:216-725(+)
MTKEGKEILGVQSARNSLIASTLLASSALVIAFEMIKEFVALDEGGTIDSVQTGAAMLCIAFLLCSFFFFSMSIRAAHHVSFLVCSHTWHDCDESVLDIIGSKSRNQTLEDRVRIVVGTMKSHTLHFSAGMRCMYLAVPAGLWLLGPWWLLGSTVAIITFVAALDHKVL